MRITPDLRYHVLIWSLVLLPGQAAAHASEKALVLLLPTRLYIASGVAAVALTVVILALLPARLAERPFATITLIRKPGCHLRTASSLLSASLLALVVWAGFVGPQDPLSNPLPLFIWTVFWIALVSVQAIFGDIWAWLNPWTGPLALIRPFWRVRPLRLPASVLQGIGTAGFLCFAIFMLADPAPADPSRLARLVAIYWSMTLLLALLFGPQWLRRAEGLTLMLRTYANLGALGRQHGLRLGLPGWQVLRGRPVPLIVAMLIVILLATGSFDGFNETFGWYDLNGINPFEAPGRSDLIGRTVAGLLVANAALLAIVALCILAGLTLARSTLPLTMGLRLFAPSILPIALGYHIAHYLPSFLVDGQYALAAMTDPFRTGADYLGLGAHYVSTGFFNTRDTVRVIFLTQAGAVVLGHVLAVMLAHAIAIRAFGSTARAVLSQAPLAVFMIGYTLFGLCLLAAPRL